MRFGDFLKATVLLCAGAATLLATLAMIGAAREDEPLLFYASAGWWVLAIGAGLWLGPRVGDTIRRLLAGARTQTALPELRPGLTLLNRLWPLLLLSIVAGVLAFWLPQVASIGAGFGLLGAVAWRRQESAVVAIEERDGVRFYVDQTSPLQPIRLIRTPGFGVQY